MRAVRSGSLACVLLAACYDPTLVPCELKCGAGASCPDGMTCESGVCASTPGECVAAIGEWTAVAAGVGHTCAIAGDGALFCWGDGSAGQTAAELLDREASPRELTVLTGLPGPAQAVATGARHTCVVAAPSGGASGGAMYCVGDNLDGQLGDPEAGARSTAFVRVGNAIDWVAVGCGTSYSCGRHADGAIECWGENGAGQLGAGLDADGVPAPAPLALARAWSALSVGPDHACALDETGVAYCWGSNYDDELGVGPGDAREPRAVLGGHVFKSISAADSHTCAIDGDDRLFCWGHDGYGQLGVGRASAIEFEPVAVTPESQYRKVAAGRYFTCAADLAGALSCWGDDGEGQLGTAGGFDRTDLPAEVPGLSAAVIAAGQAHACVIDPAGTLYCWGSTSDGQVGDGQISTRLEPTALPGTGWAEVAVGDDFTCGRTVADEVYCFGDNRRGQLGIDDELQFADTPRQLSGTYASISAGWAHACALQTGGDVAAIACWGSNEFGQVGDGDLDAYAPVPTSVELADVVSLRSGADGSCAEVAASSIETYCWGRDDHGQLGNGSVATRRSLPTRASTLEDAASLDSVAIGGDHACGHVPGDLLFCVGDDAAGQRGGSAPTATVVNVVAGDFVAVAAGEAFTCAIALTTGALFCWGDDGLGQLGNGAAPASDVPAAVEHASNTLWSSVSASRGFACGVRDGQGACWGDNQHGQLGQGDRSPRLAPAELGDGWGPIATGASHSCAIAAGQLACWGRGHLGQLGLGVSAQLGPTRVERPE